MKLTIILLAVIFLLSCGDETYYSNPEPDTPGKTLSAEAKRVLSAKCQQCHSGANFLTSYNAFKSQGQPRVKNGSMPPGGGLSDSEKSILLGE